MGGFSKNANTNNNSVVLENLDLSFSSYGEFVGGNASFGNGSANANKISLKNVQISNGNDDIIGGASKTSANGNEVIIDSSNTGNIGISGGMVFGDNASKTANSNKITITNSNLSDVCGGLAIKEFKLYKDDDEINFLGTANSNEVSISDSVFDKRCRRRCGK